MSEKKDLSHLTAEELMNVAKQGLREEVKQSIQIPPARRFVISEDLKDGEIKVPALLIYDRYAKWCVIHNESLISQREFFGELKLYFSRERTNKGVFYKMNPGGFDMSVEYLRMLNERVKEKGFSNENRKKTKKEREKESEAKKLFAAYKKETV